MATNKTNLSAPRFTDVDAARKHLEKVRWPNGVICPHCGCDERIMELKGKATRPGVYKCGDCRQQFTVTVGTVFEQSHIPLNKWVLATHLICSSKKGISAHQLHRILGVTYKTAWFMCHRIREAMRDDNPIIMGGGGKTVEADETFVGRKTKRHGKPLRGMKDKKKVLSLVERGGKVRSFHVPAVNAKTLKPIIKKQIHKSSDLMTDAATWYVDTLGRPHMDKDFNSHQSVNHNIDEYVRGNVHTNTIEGYFSIFKRGLNGVYQHCSEQHLKRYLCEYDFRYNFREKLGYDDISRTNEALKGIVGKRLTYLPVSQKQGLLVEEGL